MERVGVTRPRGTMVTAAALMHAQPSPSPPRPFREACTAWGWMKGAWGVSGEPRGEAYFVWLQRPAVSGAEKA